MRVLVIEDERPIAEFVERGLKAEGYAVTCAYDGEEGLARALSGDFSIVLLDVLLPKLSGLGVLKGIRAEDSALPVIMLTALGETEDKSRASTWAPTTISPSPSPSRSCWRESARCSGARARPTATHSRSERSRSISA
ncbi:unnamed protein product, partial [marine sediment metagenome]